MNQIKRRSSFSDRETKKFQTTINEKQILITSIEHLSNELFYEIFDYLDGIDIYEAFSNLNYRFHQLLNASSLLFGITLYPTSKKEFMQKYKQFLLINRHQLFFINIYVSSRPTPFFSKFTINSSFDRVESLVLERIELDILISILHNLACLPRLFSLSIEAWDTFENLNDVYRLIFALPMLKYNKFTFCGNNSLISLPTANNKQSSTIEHLVINHGCTFNELSTLISYTPQLRSLTFMHTNDSYENVGIILPMTLSNLKHLTIDIYYVTFDEFEIFISKIDCELNVLRLTSCSEDMTYLDGNRCEQLILKYLPKLQKFYLNHSIRFDDDYDTPVYIGKPNQFISSFWIERQWIFDDDIDYNEIIYSIRPHKERWYEYAQKQMVHSYINLSKSTRLLLMIDSSDEYFDLMNTNIERVLNVAQIYHLEIFEETCIDTLFEVLFSLPELDSLKIYSLSLPQSRCLPGDETEDLTFLSNKNQITKVNLEKMIDIEEVYFLIKLCPRMIYLKVNCISNMDAELFIRLILIKIMTKHDHPLRVLCFCVPMTGDESIKKLEKMINSEKLLVDYIIENILGDIYLKWA